MRNNASNRFIGRGMLLERLTEQVGDRALAVKILQERGHLERDGRTYTDEGMLRSMMTASERARDREARKRGLSIDDFQYIPKSNKARRR